MAARPRAAFAVESDHFIALLNELGRPAAKAVTTNGAATPAAANGAASGEMGLTSFCDGIAAAFAGRDVCFSRVPLGLNDGSPFAFSHPLDFLGGDGAGGVGAGPGLAVGAALALRGTGRMPVAILGDGDLPDGADGAVDGGREQTSRYSSSSRTTTATTTTSRTRIASRANAARPVERKWIGQMIADPAPDLAMLARGQGAIGIGRIERREDLGAAIAEGIKHVEAGKVCVIDVYVSPDLDERRHEERGAQAAGKR